MKCKTIGYSVSHLPLLAYDFGYDGARVLIIGGVHGDEIEGVQLALGLLDQWLLQFDLKLKITLVPMLNVDGVLKKTRVNANGVDLNRNLPTKDWTAEVLNPRYPPGTYALSEPENQALVKLIDDIKPNWILNLHSWKPMLNTNGNCEPLASELHKWTAYPIEPTVGYSTPGCLGTYTGIERNIPTITYEIERGMRTEDILKVHKTAVCEALKVLEK